MATNHESDTLLQIGEKPHSITLDFEQAKTALSLLQKQTSLFAEHASAVYLLRVTIL